jgi:glycosyltransferase involved in cell wall biosynthesis
MWFLSLVRFFRATEPDIAHCYLNTAGVLGGAAARLAGVPSVVTTRRSVHAFSGVKGAAFRAVTAVMDKLSDRVVAVSEAARLQAIGEGTPADKIVTIANAVDVSHQARRKLTLQGAPVIISVGTLRGIKGQLFLIDAMQHVLGSLPSARLFMVGDGPDRARLEDRAGRAGLADAVTFLGNRLDVPDLLQAADIFVLPSLVEGMPNAVLEAMAAGIPVVATRVGGVPEIVHHSETGLLVDPQSSPSLANGILRMATDLRLRESCAQRARCLVLQDFAPGRELASTENLYRDLLSAETRASCPERETA